MENKFGTLVNKRSGILQGFATDFEKSLEFEKTEKEIFDSLKFKIKRIEKLIQNNDNVKSELIQLIGSAPDSIRRMYVGCDETGSSVYADVQIYNVDSGKENVELVSGIRVLPAGDEELNEKQLMKVKYNELVSKYFDLKNSLSRLQDTLDNLKPESKKVFKLSFYELEEYGFRNNK